jgi:hypothetical protein
VLGLASVALGQCAKAPPQPAVLPVAPVKVGPEIGVVATPVPLSSANPPPVSIGRFVYAGGIAISSPDTQRLHGLSDLKFGPDGGLVAISDEGDLFEARLKLDETGRLVGLTDGKLQALKGLDGQPLQGKEKADAEGLAILPNGDRLVSFERDHRIWLYPRQPDGTYGLPRAVNKPSTTFPDNEGMEALTAYPIAGPDAYLVGGEEGEVWLCKAVGAVRGPGPAVAAGLHLGPDQLRGLRGPVGRQPVPRLRPDPRLARSGAVRDRPPRPGRPAVPGRHPDPGRGRDPRQFRGRRAEPLALRRDADLPDHRRQRRPAGTHPADGLRLDGARHRRRPRRQAEEAGAAALRPSAEILMGVLLAAVPGHPAMAGPRARAPVGIISTDAEHVVGLVEDDHGGAGGESGPPRAHRPLLAHAG